MAKTPTRGDAPTDEYYKAHGFLRVSLRVKADVREALELRVKAMGGKPWDMTKLLTALVRYHEERGWPKLALPLEDLEK